MRSELEQEFERPPSHDELAEGLDLHELDVHETYKNFWSTYFYG